MWRKGERAVEPIHYATYFDRHYLSRGLALYRSLLRHSPPFVIWVLCLDLETEQTLTRLKLEGMRLIPLSGLEAADPALLSVKSERLAVEYYWTCGPSLILDVFRRDSTVELVVYLDADLFCFGNPQSVLGELSENSILVIEQRFDPRDPIKTAGGSYNVGLLAFRRTESGLACLQQWRGQCLEWCFDRFEPARHGDQKYLDEWPARYDVRVLEYAGAGIAPWNVNSQRISYEGGCVLVEGDPLVFYHFARLRRINRWIYEMHDSRFHRKSAHPVVRRHIYAPYLRELYAAELQIREVGGRIHTGTARSGTPGELLRRSRSANVPWTKLARYRRFMFVVRAFAY
jgi:hypothetical protein